MAARIEQPLEREPVEIEPRAMTAARRKRLLERDGHKCRYPGCEVSEGLELDHIIPLELGGKDADWNFQALCTEHHKQKTRTDREAINRAKRRKLKHEGKFPPAKQKIRSRGFERRWTP